MGKTLQVSISTWCVGIYSRLEKHCRPSPWSGHYSVCLLSQGYRLMILFDVLFGPTEQNPYTSNNPAVGKVLIVCPVTLINVRWSLYFAQRCHHWRSPKNWKNEIHKWWDRLFPPSNRCNRDFCSGLAEIEWEYLSATKTSRLWNSSSTRTNHSCDQNSSASSRLFTYLQPEASCPYNRIWTLEIRDVSFLMYRTFCYPTLIVFVAMI